MKQKDKDLLAEAYKVVQKTPIKEDKKPIMTKKAPEVPKEPERRDDNNPARGWFAVYISGSDNAACESVAAKLKEFLSTISETYPGCIIDTDQGGLEYDKIDEDSNPGDDLLSQIRTRLQSIAVAAGYKQEDIDQYKEQMEDGFDPKAYDHISDEDLLEDFKEFLKYRN